MRTWLVPKSIDLPEGHGRAAIDFGGPGGAAEGGQLGSDEDARVRPVRIAVAGFDKIAARNGNRRPSAHYSVTNPPSGWLDIGHKPEEYHNTAMA